MEEIKFKINLIGNVLNRILSTIRQTKDIGVIEQLVEEEIAKNVQRKFNIDPEKDLLKETDVQILLAKYKILDAINLREERLITHEQLCEKIHSIFNFVDD